MRVKHKFGAYTQWKIVFSLFIPELNANINFDSKLSTGNLKFKSVMEGSNTLLMNYSIVF